MNEFMKILLSLSVSGTLLLLLILGLKPLYKKQIQQAMAILYLDNCCVAVFTSFYSRYYDCWEPV